MFWFIRVFVDIGMQMQSKSEAKCRDDLRGKGNVSLALILLTVRIRSMLDVSGTFIYLCSNHSRLRKVAVR